MEEKVQHDTSEETEEHAYISTKAELDCWEKRKNIRVSQLAKRSGLKREIGTQNSFMLWLTNVTTILRLAT